MRERIRGLGPSLDIGCKYNQIGDIGIDIDRTYRPQVIASALSLPFREAMFQAIVFSEVLEHLPRGTELRALNEIRRVLRPGGRLILSTPKRCLLNKLSDPAHYLIDHRHYSVRELADLFARAGFSHSGILTIGGLWNAIWSAWYYSLWSMLGIRPPKRIIQEADRELVASNRHGTTLIATANAIFR